jgi:magnesium transporter
MRRECPIADGLRWIDLQGPSPEDLKVLGEEIGLHSTSLRDCLQPDHLSKFERYGEMVFILVRTHDHEAHGGATLRAITHKIALFLHPGGLLTVHRGDQPCLERVFQRHLEGEGPADARGLLTAILHGAVLTFEGPLAKAEEALDRREAEIFDRRQRLPSPRSIHATKRRVRTIKRSLWRTLVAIQDMRPLFTDDLPHWQDLKEQAERLHAIAEELLEEATGLIHLELSISSQRTNDVMRVLTVFSAFFLPLTFIAGVYGMNFHHMPELKWPLGYAFAWIVMVGVVLAIYAWFRRRGWMK